MAAPYSPAAIGLAGGQDKVGDDRRLAWLMHPLVALAEARGTLFPWVPIFLALGIGLWFQLPFEPDWRFYGMVGGGALALGGLAWRGPYLGRPIAIALACLAVGVLAAGGRAHLVRAPMLAVPYYGPIQGRLIDIDRSQSDALRLTLDQVMLSDLAAAITPRVVRLSLHGPPPPFELTAGQIVLITGRLSAPQGPEEPGGFDFRRMAYFEQLGAIGYSQSPAVLWQEAQGFDQAISRLRLYLSRAIQAWVPGDAGAFAAGAMTGDRSGISAQVVQDLRVSSLAHLLAISGMNMAFLTGFVFALVRGGLALVPPVALRLNTKKMAAVAAFLVSAFYLALSGANVATTRAFLMMVVILGAVLLDRRALSLRNVALSATILLLWQPESLMSAGFQLSFAATVALIAGFDLVRAKAIEARLPPALRPAVGMVLSSVIAGFATTPYAAAAFNRMADYGLIANLLTAPVMSVLMGAGAVAALVAPLGLAGPPLWVMGKASAWILFVAHEISALGGAMTAIVAPMAVLVPILTIGAAWAILWRGRLRLWGVAAMGLALALWAISPRPVALVSSNGAVVGLMGPEGRALSAPVGAGFATENWLMDDGDLALADAAALRPGFSGQPWARRFTLSGVTAVVLKGKKGLAALSDSCASADLVILPENMIPPKASPGPCRLIDRRYLRRSGALSLEPAQGGLWVLPVRRTLRIWDDAPALVDPLFVAARQ